VDVREPARAEIQREIAQRRRLEQRHVGERRADDGDRRRRVHRPRERETLAALEAGPGEPSRGQRTREQRYAENREWNSEKRVTGHRQPEVHRDNGNDHPSRGRREGLDTTE
jgi:hypothetical protein